MLGTGCFKDLLQPIKEGFQLDVPSIILEQALISAFKSGSPELKALERVENLLGGIHIKLDRLTQAPAKAGFEWLNMALDQHRSSMDKRRYLERSLDCFVLAQSQLNGYEAAVTQLMISLTFVLLGQPIDAQIWMRRARDLAERNIGEAFERARREGRSSPFISEFDNNNEVISAAVDFIGAEPTRFGYSEDYEDCGEEVTYGEYFTVSHWKSNYKWVIKIRRGDEETRLPE